MYYLHTFSCTSLTNLRDLDRESFEQENKIQKKPSFFGSSSIPIGLARRADSATQSQFSVHFATKISDFFRSEFCGVLILLIRSGYEVVAKFLRKGRNPYIQPVHILSWQVLSTSFTVLGSFYLEVFKKSFHSRYS